MRQPGLLLGAVATLLVIAACSTRATQPQEAGFVGTWAGEPWIGDASATLRERGDTLYIGGFAPVDAGMMVETSLSFAVPFSGGGEYLIPPGEAYFHYLIGGDVLRASYVSTAEAPARVDFEFTSPTRVRGSVSFFARTSDADAPVGPAASFTGTFDAELTGPTPLWSGPS